MNNTIQIKKEKQSLYFYSGVCFIFSGLIFLCQQIICRHPLDFGNFRMNFWILTHTRFNANLLLIISMLFVGVGLIFSKLRSVSFVGCAIGLASTAIDIVKKYSGALGTNFFYFQKFSYVILFIFLLIILIKKDKNSFYLSCFLIIEEFALCIYIFIQWLQFFSLWKEYITYYGLIIIHFLLLLAAITLISLQLYNTKIKQTNNNFPRINNDSIQIESIIDNIFQLKTLVDHNIISAQEYITTKEKILSPLIISQQALVSPQPESWGHSSLNQSNMYANQAPQFYRPFMPLNQYPQTIQTNICDNIYSRSIQPEPFTNPNNVHNQYPDSSIMNPYQNSNQMPIKHNKTR